MQNVITIVGLRPFNAPAKIMPGQTLGRGLRRMFRGQDVDERVSVIATPRVIKFVESLRTEGSAHSPDGLRTGRGRGGERSLGEGIDSREEVTYHSACSTATRSCVDGR